MAPVGFTRDMRISATQLRKVILDPRIVDRSYAVKRKQSQDPCHGHDRRWMAPHDVRDATHDHGSMRAALPAARIAIEPRNQRRAEQERHAPTRDRADRA